MFRRDRCCAWILIGLLWLTVLFILWMSWPHLPDTGIRVAASLGALSVLVLNTASIFAMTAHYAEDKHFIYGLDIQHLDAAREDRNNRRQS